jgi:hypothetical protein
MEFAGRQAIQYRYPADLERIHRAVDLLGPWQYVTLYRWRSTP